MCRGSSWDKLKSIFLWLAAIILLVNSFVIWQFRDIIRGSHLFITSSTVFFPLAVINLAVGVSIISALVWELWAGKSGR